MVQGQGRQSWLGFSKFFLNVPTFMHTTSLPEGLMHSLNLRRSGLTHSQLLLNSVLPAQSCLYLWKCRANTAITSLSVPALQLCIAHFYCWRVSGVFSLYATLINRIDEVRHKISPADTQGLLFQPEGNLIRKVIGTERLVCLHYTTGVLTTRERYTHSKYTSMV